mmetsp:Transcript_179/g.265  ORF Transcript_179/g.265 Transcript_179/m.265 type:complete len:369 (-) Transcript_179:341-1447(-)
MTSPGTINNTASGPPEAKTKTTIKTKSMAAVDKSKWTVTETPHDTSLFPTLAAILWLGWNGGLIYLTLFAIFFATAVPRGIIIGILTLSFLLPPNYPPILGTRLGNWIAQNVSRYFALKSTVEDMESIRAHDAKGKAIIFGMEPHDILPYFVMVVNPSLQRLPGRVGSTIRVLMTGIVFHLPIIKQIYSYVGGSPIDKHTFRTRLQKGQSLAFVPGGVQEVLALSDAEVMQTSSPENNTVIPLFLKNRKGFVKLALETGSPMVPCYCFHIDKSYGYWIPKGSFITRISRSIGFLPLVFWGRGYIPFGIPQPQPLHVVFGNVIDVPCQGNNVSDESVDQYHTMFLQEMEALFERHKKEEGYGHCCLKII